MGVIVSAHDTVVEIMLDWPEQRNALGPGEGRELREAIEKVSRTDDASALVLSATGKAFCAGGDLSEILRLAKAVPKPFARPFMANSKASSEQSARARFP